jgi:hypothetical protein
LQSEDNIGYEEDNKISKMEDVRLSNFSYSQTKICELVSAFFAMLGVGASIVASEINTYHNLDDSHKEEIITMLCICNVSTGFLSTPINY